MSKIMFVMEAEKKTRGARNQKCYRDELKEINNMNARFMAFAIEQALACRNIFS